MGAENASFSQLTVVLSSSIFTNVNTPGEEMKVGGKWYRLGEDMQAIKKLTQVLLTGHGY